MAVEDAVDVYERVAEGDRIEIHLTHRYDRASAEQGEVVEVAEDEVVVELDERVSVPGAGKTTQIRLQPFAPPSRDEPQALTVYGNGAVAGHAKYAKFLPKDVQKE